MMRSLARDWWALALRGLFTVTFGLALFVWQGVTLGVVVWLFAVFALVTGGFVSIVALTRRGRKRWWLLLLEGVLGMLLGLAALLWPQLGALGLLYLIVAWGVLAGLLQILAALSLGRELTGQWYYALFGALTVLFGVLLVFVVGAELVARLWLVTLYAVVAGALLIALAWRLRRWGNTPRKVGRV